MHLLSNFLSCLNVKNESQFISVSVSISLLLSAVFLSFLLIMFSQGLQLGTIRHASISGTFEDKQYIGSTANPGS